MANLEKTLDAVLQMAQLILRDESIQTALHGTNRDERIDYWIAFFQVVLSHPFGVLAPGGPKSREFALKIDDVRRQILRDHSEWANVISSHSQRAQTPNEHEVLYAVAQFWNADDHRATAFVINRFSGNVRHQDVCESLYNYDTELTRVSDEWRAYWELMNEINKSDKANDRSNNSRENNGKLALVSIGNFIVQRSRDLHDICPIFELHVGPHLNFQRFKNQILCNLQQNGFDVLRAAPRLLAEKLQTVSPEELDDIFTHLEIPTEIVRVLLHDSHEFPNLDSSEIGSNEIHESLLSRVEALGRVDSEQLVKMVIRLAEDTNGNPIWDAWKKEALKGYLQYVRCFFLWKYSSGLSDRTEWSPPTDRQLRLILLNNLLIARTFLTGVDNQSSSEDSWHFQYFFPTFHKSTSYLAVITRGELKSWDLDCYRKFAERLFGLAWAHDSDRKLEEDKAEIIAQTERAARAAILARNFSHTVGSHVINSPGFAMALTRGEGGKDLGRKLEDLTKVTKSLNEAASRGWLRKSQTEYLEDFTRYLGVTQSFLADTRNVLDAGLVKTTKFHRFLQRRFDFIAQAIEDRPHPPEPLFFVEDLMEGFVSQTAFLDHLIKDLGWHLQNLRFHLYLPRENEGAMPSEAIFQSQWLLNEDRTSHKLVWRPTAETLGTVNDYAVLIGSPGGAIGSHAFYAVLENLIRNSFKYGAAKRKTRDDNEVRYILSLRLVRPTTGQGWRLQLWDNFSNAGDPEHDESTFSRINNYLSQPIVKSETGALIPEGLGIKEMALCARSLFAPLNNSPDVPQALRLIKPLDLESVCPPALRVAKEETELPLVYELVLKEPVLLAIYDDKNPASVGWIRRYSSLTELGRSGAHLAILPGDRLPALLQEITKIHYALPYRLLVVCRGAEQTKELTKLIQRSDLPPRRLHCFYEDLGENTAKGTLLYDLIQGVTGASGTDREVSPQDVICRVYEAWLRAWKGTPEGGKWHLWIGFERSPDTIAQTWGKLLTSHKSEERDSVCQSGGSDAGGGSFQSDLISIVVKSQVGEHAETWFSDPRDQKIVRAAVDITSLDYWKKEFGQPYSKKRALVFDNHGTCYNWSHLAEKALDYRDSTRFYQRTSGGETFELFQRLSSVPSNRFGFNFFVYNLVESCLTVVAVADERVAADLLFNPASSGDVRAEVTKAQKKLFRTKLAAHHKAGVFPVFQLRFKAGMRNRVAHYSVQHSRILRKILGYGEGEDGGEGISLRDITSGRSMLRVVAPQGSRFREEEGCDGGLGEGQPIKYPVIDFLVVHEGAVDMFRTNSKVHWDPEVTKTLFDIAPGVVRTSGRGRHSRNLGESVPFLEASALTTALVTSKNKYELSRALLGSVAETDSRI